MDLYCPRCGEPWDNETFHEVADENESTYDAVITDFRKRGCVATGWVSECEARNTLVAQASAAMFDLLGDDTDGIASMMDDFVSGY